MLARVDGPEIKRLRESRGMTQRDLAHALKVGPKTITNWETGATVPRNRLGMLREFFGLDGADTDDPIRSASEVDLLAELLRRAVKRDERGRAV